MKKLMLIFAVILFFMTGCEQVTNPSAVTGSPDPVPVGEEVSPAESQLIGRWQYSYNIFNFYDTGEFELTTEAGQIRNAGWFMDYPDDGLLFLQCIYTGDNTWYNYTVTGDSLVLGGVTYTRVW